MSCMTVFCQKNLVNSRKFMLKPIFLICLQSGPQQQAENTIVWRTLPGILYFRPCNSGFVNCRTKRKLILFTLVLCNSRCAIHDFQNVGYIPGYVVSNLVCWSCPIKKTWKFSGLSPIDWIFFSCLDVIYIPGLKLWLGIIFFLWR
jgi:hypothetical protein